MLLFIHTLYYISGTYIPHQKPLLAFCEIYSIINGLNWFAKSDLSVAVFNISTLFSWPENDFVTLGHSVVYTAFKTFKISILKIWILISKSDLLASWFWFWICPFSVNWTSTYYFMIWSAYSFPERHQLQATVNITKTCSWTAVCYLSELCCGQVDDTCHILVLLQHRFLKFIM